METVTHFFLLGSKITADTDCSHELYWKIAKDREAWCAVAHGVAKSGTLLSD